MYIQKICTYYTIYNQCIHISDVPALAKGDPVKVKAPADKDISGLSINLKSTAQIHPIDDSVSAYIYK